MWAHPFLVAWTQQDHSYFWIAEHQPGLILACKPEKNTCLSLKCSFQLCLRVINYPERSLLKQDFLKTVVFLKDFFFFFSLLMPSVPEYVTGRNNHPTLLEASPGFMLLSAASFTSEWIDVLLWAVPTACRNIRSVGCSLLSVATAKPCKGLPRGSSENHTVCRMILGSYCVEFFKFL